MLNSFCWIIVSISALIKFMDDSLKTCYDAKDATLDLWKKIINVIKGV